MRREWDDPAGEFRKRCLRYRQVQVILSLLAGLCLTIATAFRWRYESGSFVVLLMLMTMAYFRLKYLRCPGCEAFVVRPFNKNSVTCPKCRTPLR